MHLSSIVAVIYIELLQLLPEKQAKFNAQYSLSLSHDQVSLPTMLCHTLMSCTHASQGIDDSEGEQLLLALESHLKIKIVSIAIMLIRGKCPGVFSV